MSVAFFLVVFFYWIVIWSVQLCLFWLCMNVNCQKNFTHAKDKFSLPHIFVFENMHIKHIEIPRIHKYKLFVCCTEYRMRRDGLAHIYWKNMHPFHVNDLNSNLFSCLWYVCVIGCLYSVSIPISNAAKIFHCIELLFVFNFIFT